MQTNTDNIHSISDFLNFLTQLQDNYNNNDEAWENTDIKSFLEGMRGFMQDTQKNDGNMISYAKLAESFLAARVYE